MNVNELRVKDLSILSSSIKTCVFYFLTDRSEKIEFSLSSVRLLASARVDSHRTQVEDYNMLVKCYYDVPIKKLPLLKT